MCLQSRVVAISTQADMSVLIPSNESGNNYLGTFDLALILVAEGIKLTQKSIFY